MWTELVEVVRATILAGGTLLGGIVSLLENAVEQV